MISDVLPASPCMAPELGGRLLTGAFSAMTTMKVLMVIHQFKARFKF